jgi:signal transduction histidine kinase
MFTKKYNVAPQQQVSQEFLALTLHELKTPITSLKLMIHILQRSLIPNSDQTISPETVSKTLDMSAQQIDRLANAVEDLSNVVKARLSSSIDQQPIKVGAPISKETERGTVAPHLTQVELAVNHARVRRS